jgi:hypothetical protein
MIGALKWLFGLGVVAGLGIAAGVYFAFFGVGEQISYVTPDLVPIDLNTSAPADRSIYPRQSSCPSRSRRRLRWATGRKGSTPARKRAWSWSTGICKATTQAR